MFQSRHFSRCEATIRDVYRGAIEAEAEIPPALTRARGAAVDPGGTHADARCDSQSDDRSAAPEPPRGRGHFSGSLSQLPFRSLRAAHRSGCQLERAETVLRAVGAQKLFRHGLVLGAAHLFRKNLAP